MSVPVAALTTMVNGASWGMFGVATVFVGLRFYTRIRHGGGLWTDDWLILVGLLFIAASSAVLTWLMSIFLIRTSTLRVPLGRVHHNLQTIALGVTKTSFGATLLRLMPAGGWEIKLVWVLLITMNLQFAIHIVATWQQICGVPDDQHLGSGCWRLDQSVTFTIFSALYSALCDFILALLPWRLIFNLQIKLEERIGVALALSLGVLAGITGIMKAVQGYALIDITSRNYLQTQAVYWIWSQAEPNVTVISASIPVLRSFIRNVRKRLGIGSSTGAGAYVKTPNSNGVFNRTPGAPRSRPVGDGYPLGTLGKDADVESDRGILPRGEGGRGITWTREVNVDYGDGDGDGSPRTADGSREDGFELSHYPKGSVQVRTTISAKGT